MSDQETRRRQPWDEGSPEREIWAEIQLPEPRRTAELLERLTESLREARDERDAAVKVQQKVKQRLRLILTHEEHEPTAHCLAEIALHARVALASLSAADTKQGGD